MHDPSLWYIRQLGLTRRVPSDIAAELRKLGRLERWGHRAIVTRRPSDIVVIMSGGMDLNDGAHRDLVRLKPGDLFGDNGKGADGDVLRAFDDTTVLRLDRDAFDTIVSDHLGTFGTTVGLRKRKNLSIPVSELLYRPSIPRIARGLELLSEAYGEVSGGRAEVPILLKPRHIAELTGVAAPRTRKILEMLEGDRLIEVGRNGLVVPDVSSLALLVDRWNRP